MKIAIVIGHDSKSPGAYSKYLGTSEYIYNSEVASYLSCVADIYKRPNVRGYTNQMEELSKQLEKGNYDLVAELHFNSFNKKTHGTETVTYKGNMTTLKYGKVFNEIISKDFDVKNRGQKTVVKGGRGFGFLSLVKADAIIVEPFFGDNGESLNFKDHKQYAASIIKWIKAIS